MKINGETLWPIVSILPRLIVAFFCIQVSCRFQACGSTPENLLEDAYTLAITSVEQQRNTVPFVNIHIAIEPVVDQFANKWGAQILPLLELQIKKRIATPAREFSGDDEIKYKFDLMALAKIGRHHDVADFVDELWLSTEGSAHQMYVAFNLSYLPPDQYLAWLKARYESGDNSVIRLLTEVGDKALHDQLDQRKRTKETAIDDINLGMMQRRIQESREVQEQWLALDQRYRVWLRSDRSQRPGDPFSRDSYMALLGKGIATDGQMKFTSDYLNALGSSTSEDFYRWRQLIVLCIALAERGDESSKRMLHELSIVNPDLPQGLLNRDFVGGKRALLTMLHPGGRNNAAILDQLKAFGGEYAAEQLAKFRNDESYTEAERVDIEEARMHILDRLPSEFSAPSN